VKRYLHLCEEIEEIAGEIYQQLAKKEDVPDELKKTLLELSRDEENHAMQLRFATRFAEGTVLCEKKYDLAEAQELLTRIRALRDKTAGASMTTAQCLNLALELERDFCKIHLGASSEFVNENTRKMFSALARDDKIHVEKLTTACERFGQPRGRMPV
jgi:rubrerythrin